MVLYITSVEKREEGTKSATSRSKACLVDATTAVCSVLRRLQQREKPKGEAIGQAEHLWSVCEESPLVSRDSRKVSQVRSFADK